MLVPRIIPILLNTSKGLVKTVKFQDAKYVGDPINAIKIFNEKEVDEIIFLDIECSKLEKEINYSLISNIASECFMPLTYGGGVRDISSIRKILQLGVEKVCINSAAIENTNFLREAISTFGSSTIVVSIDVKKNWFGKYIVYGLSGRKKSSLNLEKYVQFLDEIGVGEIMINSIDNDGKQLGYDLLLISRLANLISVPLIASGGARDLIDIKNAITEGASAAAAGSMFVFHGKHRAVLITYPNRKQIKSLFKDGI